MNAKWRWRTAVGSAAVVLLMSSPILAASSDVPVTLPFNRQVFATGPTNQPPTCTSNNQNAQNCVTYFDEEGDALPAANAPKPGNLSVKAQDGNTVTFNFPSTSGKDSLSIEAGQAENNIPVTPGNYSELDLLAGAGNGPAPLTITFKYSDGSTSTQQVSVPDWYNKSLPLAVTFPGRWAPAAVTTTMQTASNGIGLFALSVPVTSSKTLESFSIQNTAPTTTNGQPILDVANILAATLEGTATGQAPSSSALTSATFVSAASSSSSASKSGSSSSATSSSSSASTSGSSVPKTGASLLLLVEGAALALAGAGSAFALRARARRS